MRSDYYHAFIYTKIPLYHSDSQKWFKIGGTVISTHLKMLSCSRSSGKGLSASVNRLPCWQTQPVVRTAGRCSRSWHHCSPPCPRAHHFPRHGSLSALDQVPVPKALLNFVSNTSHLAACCHLPVMLAAVGIAAWGMLSWVICFQSCTSREVQNCLWEG